jgi:hypothetical protein
MFDMIVYVSTPYSIEHLSTQNAAVCKLNRALAGIYRRNKGWAAVNALYSFYNNPNGTEDNQLASPKYKVLFGIVNTLMRSAQVHIVLRTPGWEYCDIVLAECACAAQLGIPTVFEEV